MSQTQETTATNEDNRGLSAAEGGGEATTPSPTSHDMSLSTLDKIKRFFFSKEEWEAYLLEKLEEEKTKKDGKSSPVKAKEDTDQKSVISWIKTVFPSQDDANTFLKSQLDKLQLEKSELSSQTEVLSKPDS